MPYVLNPFTGKFDAVRPVSAGGGDMYAADYDPAGGVRQVAFLDQLGLYVPAARVFTAGTGLSGGGNLSMDRSFNLADTSVIPGSYTLAGITVDQQGRITEAANGSGVAVSAGNAVGQMLFWNGTLWVPASGLSWDDTSKILAVGTGTHTTDMLGLGIIPQLQVVGVGTRSDIYVRSATSNAFIAIDGVNGSGIVLADTGVAKWFFANDDADSEFKIAQGVDFLNTYFKIIPTTGYVGIAASRDTTPKRRLDVLDDTNPQLRLTNTDNSIYTDFQTGVGGVLEITPTGGNVNIIGTSGPQIRGSYDASNYFTMEADSGGDLWVLTTGENLNFGYSAGLSSVGDSLNNFGYNAGLSSSGSFLNNFGRYAGRLSSGSYLNNFGDLAGRYVQTDYNSAIGNQAWSEFLDDATGNKTFDNTNINVETDRVGIVGHGFGTTGTYVNLRYTEGTAPVTGLTDQEIYQVKIIDSDTIGFYEADGPNGANRGVDITDAGSGTGHTLTPQYEYDNVICIGNSSSPNRSRSIYLGGIDHDIVELDVETTVVNNLLGKQGSVEIIDDASVDLPVDIAGWGKVVIGNGGGGAFEWANFNFQTDGTVFLESNSANVANTDTDGSLCVFDNGTGVSIRNRLGATLTLRYEVKYS